MSSSSSLSGQTYRKISCVKLGTNFREVARLVEARLPASLGPKQIIVKTSFVGINASDINFTAGKYTPGVQPPFDTGFELLGRVVAAGSAVPSSHGVGRAVAMTEYGAFAEYRVVPYKRAVPVPSDAPQVMPLLVSGLTASLALEQVGELNRHKEKEVVLVTAAAGGTGVFAVQLAKLKGNHVIGTCSTAAKAAMLKRLGCDRVINYKKEDVMGVLKTEYPQGVDVVYESVGGAMFEAAVKNLAIGGRLIVIGFISGYQNSSGFSAVGDGKGKKGGGGISLPARLLGTSSSVRGFFLNHYAKHWKRHLGMLFQLVQSGELHSVVDLSGGFVGLESIPDAIDYMYAGKNAGKLVVTIAGGSSPASASKL